MKLLETGSLERTKGYKYFMFLILFMGYILVYFHRYSPAVIALEIQRELNLTGTLLGVLGSAYFYTYGAMQLPTGLLADSWGPRKTVASFFLIAAAGSILMGLAPNLKIAILGRVLVGIGASTLFVCNFKLLSEWFEPRGFVIMGGIFMATGGIGTIFSSVLLAWFSDVIGWRITFVLIGMITLSIAVLTYGFIRDKPQERGWPALCISEKGERISRVTLMAGVKQVVKAKRFWPLSIWCFFTTGMFFAFAGLWAGPYLVHVYGLSKSAVGGILSVLALALILGSPVLSLISNYVGRRPIFIGCSVILLAVFNLLYLFPGKLPQFILYVLFFCLSLSGTAAGHVQATVSKELFPSAVAGTAVGIVNIFPFFGGALFQILFGVIISYSGHIGGMYSFNGYQRMLLLCGVGAMISLVAAFHLQETLRFIGAKKDIQSVVRN
jgi:sugar phosphate permease